MENKDITVLFNNMWKVGVEGFDVPWGKIYKSELINNMFQELIEIYRELFHLNQSASISLGEMQPNAFHRPFIRHTNSQFGKPMSIYQVLSGTVECTRQGEYKVLESGDFITVNDDEIFSFKAGDEGSLFAIITYPAFQPNQYINEVL